MALFDGSISLQTNLEEAWKAAQQTLTPAEKIVSNTPNSAFVAMDSVLGYLYIFRIRSNGEIAVRLLIDEVPRVREVFRTYKGMEALELLATLGGSDPIFTERINHMGRRRLKDIAELVGVPTQADPALRAIVPAQSIVHVPSAPDWLTGLSSAVPPEGRTTVPKVLASPYAEPIVRDRLQLFWVVGIISAVFILGLILLSTFINRTSADRSYAGQWFSLQLPDGWSKIAPDNRLDLCTTDAVCTLVIGKDSYHFVALYFGVETDATPLTQANLEANYWYNFQAQHPDDTFVNQHTEQIAGRSAVIIEYQVPHNPDIYYLTRHIVLLNPTTSLHIVGYAVSAFQYEETRQEIEQIIQSITINS